MNNPILSVTNLFVSFERKHPSNALRAVDGVSFNLFPREVLGLVGESGCGKTTLSRAIMCLTPINSGSVVLLGTDLTKLTTAQIRKHRARMQMVFQDPYASLNPRMTVFDMISEPLRFHRRILRADCPGEVAGLMQKVGLDIGSLRKFPHEFSGGQRQRIAIARALAVGPELIIADEPVSALDVSVQAQILNLLSDLRRAMGLAMLFISHDLSVVRYISDRIAVMFKGKIVEIGMCSDIFESPLHPYTKALLAALPIADPDHSYAAPLQPVFADMPSEEMDNQGCPYVSRCPYALSNCKSIIPPMEPLSKGDDHQAACIRKHELMLT
jgi:oligopeptide/dipeptide ABC transporter, ATP-binding protein, C-terminal domain